MTDDHEPEKVLLVDADGYHALQRAECKHGAFADRCRICALETEVAHLGEERDHLKHALGGLIEQWKKKTAMYSTWDDAADELQALLAQPETEKKER